MEVKDLNIIVCVPHDLYFISECEVQIVNFRQFGYSKQLTILIFEEDKDTKINLRTYWDNMKIQYPEINFKFYSTDTLTQLLKVYPPVIRPWMLLQYWKEFPELENKNILYLDSDVLFTRPIDFSVFTDNKTCYLSKTNYISSTYFESKSKDVMFHKREDYKTIDVLDSCCRIVGIDKQQVIDNINCTGGCQYFLRGINSSFWQDLLSSCIELRLYTKNINEIYFSSEDKGFQSWAIGDMCGLLWNLWKRGIKTECPDEMNFSWSSSPIEEYDKCLFFHNAGVSTKYITVNGVEHKMFHKTDTRFRTGVMTFFDVKEWGEVSNNYCSYKYIEAIKEVKDPVCITTNIYY